MAIITTPGDYPNFAVILDDYLIEDGSSIYAQPGVEYPIYRRMSAPGNKNSEDIFDGYLTTGGSVYGQPGLIATPSGGSQEGTRYYWSS